MERRHACNRVRRRRSDQVAVPGVQAERDGNGTRETGHHAVGCVERGDLHRRQCLARRSSLRLRREDEVWGRRWRRGRWWRRCKAHVERGARRVAQLIGRRAQRVAIADLVNGQVAEPRQAALGRLGRGTAKLRASQQTGVAVERDADGRGEIGAGVAEGVECRDDHRRPDDAVGHHVARLCGKAELGRRSRLDLEHRAGRSREPLYGGGEGVTVARLVDVQVAERGHSVHRRYGAATVERGAAGTVIERDGDQAGELRDRRVRGVTHGDLDGSDPLAGAGAFGLRGEGQRGGAEGTRGRWRACGLEQLIEPARCSDDRGERQKAEDPHGTRESPQTAHRPGRLVPGLDLVMSITRVGPFPAEKRQQVCRG